MAKTTRPDRRRGKHRREASEFEEATLSVDRVTRVVAGGRRMRFRAIVVLGNKRGKVGLGTGKAGEVQLAVKKAASDARRHMVRVPLVDGTIPHEVNVKHKAAKIRLLPAAEGTGIIAGGAVRVILEHAGVRNAFGKRFGSSNKLVNAQATMKALEKLKWPSGLALHGEEEKAPVLEEVVAAEEDAATREEEQKLNVREIGGEDVTREGTLRG